MRVVIQQATQSAVAVSCSVSLILQHMSLQILDLGLCDVEQRAQADALLQRIGQGPQRVARLGRGWEVGFRV